MTIKETISNYLKLINDWVVSTIAKYKKDWLVVLFLILLVGSIISTSLNTKMIENLMAQNNVENGDESPLKKKK